MITFIDKDRARVLFGALDASRDGEISIDEFKEICVLLAVRFRRIADERTFIGRAFPTFFSSTFVMDAFVVLFVVPFVVGAGAGLLGTTLLLA